MKAMLKTVNISYQANQKVILENLNLEIDQGERVALLGENGSGKTTFLNVLLGDIQPSGGEVEILGNSKLKNFNELGVSYDHSPLFPLLKVKEIIKYFCVIRKINYNHTLAKYDDAFKLRQIESSFLHELSQGEKKRISLVLAVMHRPKLLILDEPFASLDPTIISTIWDRLVEDSQTILLTSHNWHKMEEFSTKICFLHQGRLIQSPKKPEEIINNLPATNKLVVESDQIRESFLEGIPYYRKNGLCNFFFSQDSLLEKIAGITKNFSIQETTLEDAYLYRVSQLTNHNLQ